MAQHKASDPPIVAAARALERELDELAQRADNIKRGPLTTEKQIVRARELVAGVASAEDAVRARLAALERAVEAANATRAAQVAAIAERAPHIEARAAELQRLLNVYVGLGVRHAGGRPGAGEVGALAREADELLGQAKRGDFPDVVRMAEALVKLIAASATSPSC